MKRIKAYTILEVLVAMVISTLVISGSFLAYDMTYKQFKHYQEVSYSTNEAVTFHSVLGKDMAGSTVVRVTDKGLECIPKGEKVSYEFKSDYVLRKVALVTDTFHVNQEDLLLTFRNVEQKVTGALVDKVTFRINLRGEKQDAVLCKHYGADGQMNELIKLLAENGRY